jgi:hypothetical protein
MKFSSLHYRLILARFPSISLLLHIAVHSHTSLSYRSSLFGVLCLHQKPDTTQRSATHARSLSGDETHTHPETSVFVDC